MSIEITPASISQVVKGRGGRRILIENDVCDVAKRLREIDDRLRLHYVEDGEYFMVTLEGAARGGRPHLVGTYQEAHTGLVEHVRRLASGTYDASTEGDRIDAQIERERNAQFLERVGEHSERLAHAIRMDLKKGRPGPVYIPPDVY